MGRAAGFRNVLVHDYVRVDDALVEEKLTELDDLREVPPGAWRHPQ